jgi:(E)-4-hydroxy-3-methylbut-2-enyl-diphosphate synthase
MTRYCETIYRTTRWKTREVKIGSVGVGGDNPIRIQSMTTSNTRDAEATAAQIMQLADMGCEIVRVTVQGKKEAISCEAIKNLLVQRGYTIPLVADIHFYPPAALLVAEFVDKVRINPGNFVDRRARFRTIEYDDAAYAREILRIEEGFTPLVEKCKRRKVAMRIGTNHGSLSDRIMNRYGDSPRGMVESALEFARVCRKFDYHDFLFSMKASNPVIMIEAYRLLVAEMMNLGWNYPLHLGVTEAGEGEDGRIKSAMGIGALLMDGLGDTIRVSLTEDSWREIDPCRRLVRFAQEREGKGIKPFVEKQREFRRKVENPLHSEGAVVLKVEEADLSNPEALEGVDAVWFDKLPGMKILEGGFFPLDAPLPEWILFKPSISPIHETRRLIDDLKERGLDIPVVICLQLHDDPEEAVIRAAVEAGALLCDGLGEGICLLGNHSLEFRKKMSFNLLQGARMRMSKTDYISCPSCGRTLFDLQDVSRSIRERTSHLAGVKIAIMGCIVNGPGEMADADFGYVGSKPGMIDLYVGKTCVEKDIDFADAVDKLIALIAAHGKWVDNPGEKKESLAIIN